LQIARDNRLITIIDGLVTFYDSFFEPLKLFNNALISVGTGVYLSGQCHAKMLSKSH
jgi:hypothetical protein